MNSPTLGLRVASVIFGLMGLAHVIRIIAHLNVQIGSCPFGRRWSALAVIVLGALSIWMCKLASAAAKSKTETPPAKPAG